jgi:16S rRNA (guanine966-N2)-methyltransferase
MRIIGGAWAGWDLVSPGARIRPTAEGVRGRWLDLLAGSLEGARVLDLFAGSGALGLEALSRGAARVDFVENGSASLHALKANVAACRATKRSRIFKRDAIPFMEALSEGAYDIAFADPPYGSKKLDRVVNRWQEVPFARILGVEHQKDHRLEGKAKRYDLPGETRLTLFTAPKRRPG